MSNDLKFKISHKVTEDNSSNFTIKPLDRGYGITIGNSLRLFCKSLNFLS